MFDLFSLSRMRSKAWRALRAQLLSQRKGSGPAERELARRLRRLRAEIAQETVDCESCRKCAVGYPSPHGAWSGGYCCGAQTEQIFTEDEIACLADGGARLRDYWPVDRPQGCLFRGPRGCQLKAADRPNICAHYLCEDLKRELADSGKLEQLEASAETLMALFQDYRRLRTARWADQCLEVVPEKSEGKP